MIVVEQQEKRLAHDGVDDSTHEVGQRESRHHRKGYECRRFGAELDNLHQAHHYRSIVLSLCRRLVLFVSFGYQGAAYRLWRDFLARHAQAFLSRACHGREQPKGYIDNQRHGEEQDEKPLQDTGKIHLAQRERGKGQQHRAHSPYHDVATAAIMSQSGDHAASYLVLAVAVKAMCLDVIEHAVYPFAITEVYVYVYSLFGIFFRAFGFGASRVLGFPSGGIVCRRVGGRVVHGTVDLGWIANAADNPLHGFNVDDVAALFL